MIDTACSQKNTGLERLSSQLASSYGWYCSRILKMMHSVALHRNVEVTCFTYVWIIEDYIRIKYWSKQTNTQS